MHLLHRDARTSDQCQSALDVESLYPVGLIFGNVTSCLLSNESTSSEEKNRNREQVPHEEEKMRMHVCVAFGGDKPEDCGRNRQSHKHGILNPQTVASDRSPYWDENGHRQNSGENLRTDCNSEQASVLVKAEGERSVDQAGQMYCQTTNTGLEVSPAS